MRSGRESRAAGEMSSPPSIIDTNAPFDRRRRDVPLADVERARGAKPGQSSPQEGRSRNDLLQESAIVYRVIGQTGANRKLRTLIILLMMGALIMTMFFVSASRTSA